MSSSDEAEETSPVLPRDSDRGSSVSSLLQDEYEELLRSAVVTPRLDAAGGGQLLLGTSSLRSLHSLEGDDHARQRHPAAAAGRSASRASSVKTPTPAQRSSRQTGRSPTPSHRSSGQSEKISSPPQRSRQASRSPTPSHKSSGQSEKISSPPQRSRQASRSPTPLQRSRQASRSPTPSQRSRQMERSPAPSSHRSRPRSRQSERTPSPSQRSSTRQTSPKPSSSDALLTELFICEENISQMENLLDTWSVHLKSNVVAELRRWRLLFVEQHQRELGRERDRVHVLQAEAEDLGQLLDAYQTSGHRKDTVIGNLTAALDRQREKVDMMRTLTHWRLQHSHRQDEAHALRRAQQHHHAVLKRKVFLGWRSLLRGHWKETVERDCRTRAQDVCTRLAAEYDAKLAEHVQALEAAQAEMEGLRLERERYEDAMKKSFMRGVCALNMEALSMFHNTEDTDDADSAAIGQFSSHPGSSTHFSPAHFDPTPPPPSQNAPPQEAIDSTTRLISTSVIHSSLPPGGTAGSQKRSRVVVRAEQQQQKPSNKTVTARITAHHAPSARRTPRNHLAKKTAHNGLVKTAAAAPPRPDLVKTTRSRLRVMGVAPPMSSVMVERHHPVTQLTVGQATAAMFPRPSQHHSAGPGGKPLPHGSAHSSCDLPHARRPLLPSRHTHSSCDTHAIKIVD